MINSDDSNNDSLKESGKNQPKVTDSGNDDSLHSEDVYDNSDCSGDEKQIENESDSVDDDIKPFNDIGDDEDSNDEDENGDNSGSSDDEDILEELAGVKHRLQDDDKSQSSAKKSKLDNDNSDNEEDVQFVREDYGDIDHSNILPRGTRRAALLSGLAKSNFKTAAVPILSDCSEEEAEF
jgi:hypothetical protein